MGMLTAREGLRWHLIEKTRGQYDFSSVLPFLKLPKVRAFRSSGTCCISGGPSYLDIFDAEWVEAFAGFAGAFGRLLHKRNDPNRLSWRP